MTKRRYNLAVIRYRGTLLLLNRIKPPFTGLWNGIGGKTEPDETPISGMQRELFEETGLQTNQYTLQNAGWIDWHIDGEPIAPIDIFLVDILPTVQLPLYPIGMREGVLQLFEPEWAQAADNQGIVADLQAILPTVLSGQLNRYDTDFHADQMIFFEAIPITEPREGEEAL